MWKVNFFLLLHLLLLLLLFSVVVGDARHALRIADYALREAVDMLMEKPEGLAGPVRPIVDLKVIVTAFKDLGWNPDALRQRLRELTMEAKMLLVAMLLSDFTVGTYRLMKQALSVHLALKGLTEHQVIERTYDTSLRLLVSELTNASVLAGGEGSFYQRSDEVAYRISFSPEDLCQVLGAEGGALSGDHSMLRAWVDRRNAAKRIAQEEALAAAHL